MDLETTPVNIHVPELKIKYPKRRRAPPGMPSLYNLGMICASRGSGKTTVMVRILKAYDAAMSFDHLWLWAPCFHSDPKHKLLERGTHFKLHLYDRDFSTFW